MDVKEGGQLPTGMSDVFAYLKHEGSWKDETVNITRQFLYWAKYGEFLDKQADWQDVSEREWLKKLSI